jgi:hypothetical protein
LVIVSIDNSLFIVTKAFGQLGTFIVFLCATFRYEPPVPTRVGKKKKRVGGKGPDSASKLPLVTPHTKCRLRLLKQERIKDYLLMVRSNLK